SFWISRRASSRMTRVMPAKSSLCGTSTFCATAGIVATKNSATSVFILLKSSFKSLPDRGPSTVDRRLLSNLSYQHDAIPYRQQNVLHAWITLYFFIEFDNGLCIGVRIWLQHLTAPQHVVGQDKAIQIYTVYHQIEVARVIFFIRVDKYEIEFLCELR